MTAALWPTPRLTHQFHIRDRRASESARRRPEDVERYGRRADDAADRRTGRTPRACRGPRVRLLARVSAAVQRRSTTRHGAPATPRGTSGPRDAALRGPQSIGRRWPLTPCYLQDAAIVFTESTPR